MRNNNYKRYLHNRRRGYGVGLYRNVRDKKLGGVCAGVGDHFEIDHNIVRILFIGALIFTGFLAFWSYIIAWIILAPRPVSNSRDEFEAWQEEFEYDERARRYRKKNVFRYRESASVRLRRARQRLEDIAKRVDDMERYVTSNKYDLNRKFADL